MRLCFKDYLNFSKGIKDKDTIYHFVKGIREFADKNRCSPYINKQQRISCKTAIYYWALVALLL